MLNILKMYHKPKGIHTNLTSGATSKATVFPNKYAFHSSRSFLIFLYITSFGLKFKQVKIIKMHVWVAIKNKSEKKPEKQNNTKTAAFFTTLISYVCQWVWLKHKNQKTTAWWNKKIKHMYEKMKTLKYNMKSFVYEPQNAWGQ